jgi:hypothetical protein
MGPVTGLCGLSNESLVSVGVGEFFVTVNKLVSGISFV